MKCEETLREEALRESSPKIHLTLTVHKSFHKAVHNILSLDFLYS